MLPAMFYCAIEASIKSELDWYGKAKCSTFAPLHWKVTAMSRLKDETLSIRTSAEIKQLLRVAAERERRSVASMIEILVLEYARKHDLKPERQDNDPTNGGV